MKKAASAIAVFIALGLAGCGEEIEELPEVVDLNGEEPEYYTPLLPPEEPELTSSDDESMLHSISCYCVLSPGTWYSPPCAPGWENQCIGGYTAGRCVDPLLPNCVDGNGQIYCC